MDTAPGLLANQVNIIAIAGKKIMGYCIWGENKVFVEFHTACLKK